MNIEQSQIESKFFEVYEADSVELKQVLLFLERAFMKHRDRLKEELGKIYK